MKPISFSAQAWEQRTSSWYSSPGRTAAKAAIDGTTATINVETLAPGTYVVTVATADGSRRSAKLIKR